MPKLCLTVMAWATGYRPLSQGTSLRLPGIGPGSPARGPTEAEGNSPLRQTHKTMEGVQGPLEARELGSTTTLECSWAVGFCQRSRGGSDCGCSLDHQLMYDCGRMGLGVEVAKAAANWIGV